MMTSEKRSFFSRYRLSLLFLVCLVLASAAFIKLKKSEERIEDITPSVKPLLAELPLASLIMNDQQTEIVSILERGEDIHAADALGRTALHIAAFYGNTKVSALLLEKGADIEREDNIGMRPLHAAVLSGGRAEVELLLDKGADLEARTQIGQTPLHLAAATGQPKLTRLLLSRGANIDAIDQAAHLPLAYAQQNNHPQTTAVLQQYQANKKKAMPR